MSKDTYKKRLKGNWRQGKGYKGDAEERQYSKTEIEAAIKHEVEGQPTKYKGKRKRNKKMALEHQIEWYQQKITEFERNGYKGSCIDYFRNALREAKKKYKEEYGDKE